MSHHTNNHNHADSAVPATGPSALVVELRRHVPFSVSAVTIGLIVAGTICILRVGIDKSSFAAQFFHLFHPAHMLFSAAATTAMFCRYERKVGKAIVIGLIGAIGVCGVSDIAIPQLSLLLLGVEAPWHICIIEHWDLALPFAAVGVLMGLWAAGDVLRSTIISHSLHVFFSTMASIFYMIGPIGVVAWISDIGRVFVLVVVAVMIPCCVSDIIFPLLMSRAGRDRHARAPHVH